MRPPANRPPLISRINFVWYVLTLLPILALFLAGAYGYLPNMVALFAVFLMLFWIFSFLGALWTLVRKPREPRS